MKRLTNRFIQLFRPAALVGLCFVMVGGIADQGATAECSDDVMFWAEMKKVWVKFTAEKEKALLIAAWMAKSPEQRARGFQGVCPDLVIKRSLLFSFPMPVRVKFHMTGVVVPLDIAFIDVSKQVIDIQRMTRQELNTPVRYYLTSKEIHFALETTAGRLDQLKRNPGLWRMQISKRN